MRRYDKSSAGEFITVELQGSSRLLACALRKLTFRAIMTIGIIGLAYAVLAGRALHLDAEVGRTERDIARAKFRVLQAKRDLYAQLTPAAIGPTPETASAPSRIEEHDIVATPELPPLEASVLASLTGEDARELPSDVAVVQPDEETPSRVAQAAPGL